LGKGKGTTGGFSQKISYDGRATQQHLAPTAISKEVKMGLQRKVELISNSTNRLMEVLELPRRDEAWWWFMRWESWLHLRRSLELWWMVLRRKE